MQPMGRPLVAKRRAPILIRPPKAVQGEICLGSPVQLNPAGAVAGVAGHRKTSALSSVNKVERSRSISLRSSKYRLGAMARPS